jgi:hypothetical protein
MRTPEREHLSLCRSSVRGTWKGASLLGFGRIWGTELRGRASLSVGAQVGSRGLVYRGLEQQALETGISPPRVPVENHGGGGRSPGTLRDTCN